MRTITRFIADDQGADLIEYALLAGLISLAAVTTIGAIGTRISAIFTFISNKLNEVTIP